jgi:hypothetical protein
LTKQFRPENGRLIEVKTDPDQVAEYRRIHEAAVTDPDCLPSRPWQLQRFGLDRLEKKNREIEARGGEPLNVKTQAEFIVEAIADPYSPPITDAEMDELISALRRANKAKYEGGGWGDPHDLEWADVACPPRHAAE